MENLGLNDSVVGDIPSWKFYCNRKLDVCGLGIGLLKLSYYAVVRMKWRRISWNHLTRSSWEAISQPLHHNRKLASFPGPAQLSLLAVRKVGGVWERGQPVPKSHHCNRKLASFLGFSHFFFCSSVCIQYNTWKWKSGSVYYTERKPNNKNVGRPGDDETNRKLNVVWNLTHK